MKWSPEKLQNHRGMRGKKHPVETKEKMRIAAIARGDGGGAKKLIGRKRPRDVIEKMKATMFKKGHKTWNRNKPYPQVSGKKNWNWKGGITPEIVRIRTSLEYTIWRRGVFERDNYTCIWCGIRSQKGVKVILHADHIKPFALYPELRFALDNGRTLCAPCHKTTDTYGSKTRKL